MKINSTIDKIRAEKNNIYAVFAVTFIVLMAINGFFFMGFSFGHDSWDVSLIFKEVHKNVRFTQGRPMAFAVNEILFQSLNLPWIIGIIECINISLLSLLIIKMIDIKSRFYQVITAIIVGSNISIISINCFLQDGTIFTLGFLLATLGAYFYSKDSLLNYILGTLVITISINLYQAHFVVAFSLCALLLFKDIISDDFSFKNVLIKILKMLISLAVAMIIYIVTWDIILKITGLERTPYLGMDNLGIDSIKKIPYLIIPTFQYAVKELFLPGFRSYIPVYLTVMNIIMSVSAVYLAVKSILKKNNKKLQILFFAILILALPLIIFFNYILSFGATETLPGKFSFVVVPILIIYIMYLNDHKTARVLSALFAFIIFINSFVGGNVVSAKRRYEYENGMAFANQIISRIQNEPGFTPNKKIMFIGGEPDIKPYSRDFAWCDNVEGANVSQSMNNFVATMAFLKRFSPQTEVLANDPKYMRHEKVLALDLFPAHNCVTVIDDIYIIRLANW